MLGKERCIMPKKKNEVKEQPNNKQPEVYAPQNNIPAEAPNVFDEVWDEVFSEDKEKEKKKSAPKKQEKNTAPVNTLKEIDDLWDDAATENYKVGKFDNSSKKKPDIFYKASFVPSGLKKAGISYNEATLKYIKEEDESAKSAYFVGQGIIFNEPEYKTIGRCYDDLRKKFKNLIDVEEERKKLNDKIVFTNADALKIDRKYKVAFRELKESVKRAYESQDIYFKKYPDSTKQKNDPSTGDRLKMNDGVNAVHAYTKFVSQYATVRELNVNKEHSERIKNLTPQEKSEQRYRDAQEAITSTAQALADGLLLARGKKQYPKVCEAVSALGKSYNAMIDAEKLYIADKNNEKNRQNYEKALKAVQEKMSAATLAAANYNEYKKGTKEWGIHAGKNARKRIDAVARVDSLAEAVNALVSPKLKKMEEAKKQAQLSKSNNKEKSLK